MPNDLLTLNALALELNSLLAGGKIEKVYQPEKDEIVMTIRSHGVKHSLVISCNAQNPRIHLSTIKKENPMTAPQFCMHLRKYITSGVIESVGLLASDRIFDIAIISKNELKDTIKLHLIAEMMGRYSNILLVNDKMRISDVVKQVSFDMATKRCVLPSATYTVPDQAKISPFDSDGIAKCLSLYNVDSAIDYPTEPNIAKYILSNIGGLAYISAQEIVHMSKVSLDIVEPLTTDQISSITTSFDTMFNIFDRADFSPCVSVDEKGNAVDYFVKEYGSCDNQFSATSSMSEAIQSLTLRKDISERHREKSKHLYGALKKYRSRNDKKLKKAQLKLTECENMDIYRKYGELITSNLYKLSKGDTELVTTDYYVEGMPEITIPLNVQYSPSKCGQDYFKRYNKLKRTLDVIVGQIDETKSILDYTGSIEANLSVCNSPNDLLQIEEELFAIGAIKKMKNKQRKGVKAGSPLLYEYMEHLIAVGKNNIQNDKLTFKTANGGDMWLHTLGYHGSHVIIFIESGEVPPNEVIQFACELAGYYSQGSENDKVAVDYTSRKNVKRDASGNLGMVTYSNQSTAYVAPNNHLEYLKQK